MRLFHYSFIRLITNSLISECEQLLLFSCILIVVLQRFLLFWSVIDLIDQLLHLCVRLCLFCLCLWGQSFKSLKQASIFGLIKGHRGPFSPCCWWPGGPSLCSSHSPPPFSVQWRCRRRPSPRHWASTGRTSPDGHKRATINNCNSKNLTWIQITASRCPDVVLLNSYSKMD